MCYLFTCLTALATGNLILWWEIACLFNLESPKLGTWYTLNKSLLDDEWSDYNCLRLFNIHATLCACRIVILCFFYYYYWLYVSRIGWRKPLWRNFFWLPGNHFGSFFFFPHQDIKPAVIRILLNLTLKIFSCTVSVSTNDCKWFPGS